ncbi:MAG: histidine phosphatase family protein [Granulosicoccus sp.]
MRFHLVRHGQTHWNVQRRIQGQLDSELDELGFLQATERGKDFADMPLEACYSSSSVRTRQTIKNLLGSRTDAVEYMDELKEVCWGIWQGAMWADLEASHPDMVEAYHKALPHFFVEGAETPAQTQSRGVAAFECLVERHQNASSDVDILVVSHGAIMKKILGNYTGIELTELHRLAPLPNCAHCIIEVDGDKRRVTQIAGERIEDTPWYGLSS